MAIANKESYFSEYLEKIQKSGSSCLGLSKGLPCVAYNLVKLMYKKRL